MVAGAMDDGACKPEPKMRAAVIRLEFRATQAPYRGAIMPCRAVAVSGPEQPQTFCSPGHRPRITKTRTDDEPKRFYRIGAAGFGAEKSRDAVFCQEIFFPDIHASSAQGISRCFAISHSLGPLITERNC